MHLEHFETYIVRLKFSARYVFFPCILILFSSFLLALKCQGQSITPFIFNNIGGFSPSMEWNIGEGVSVTSFKSSNGFSLNTGGLQPLTNIVTSINEYGPAVFGDQILLGPNPAINFLHIKARFKELGNLSLQLLDERLAIVLTKETGTQFYQFDTDLILQQYPSGIYYMRVYFKPINGQVKIGIYKIVKL